METHKEPFNKKNDFKMSFKSRDSISRPAVKKAGGWKAAPEPSYFQNQNQL